MSDGFEELDLRPADPGVSVTGPVKTAGMGGAYEGAEVVGRELASWRAPITSADSAIRQTDKELLDARVHDLRRNHGAIQGADTVYRDSIVGSHYRLTAQPNTRVLGPTFDETWAEEFASEVEAKFSTWADSDENWFDASRRNNLTSFVRLAIGCFFAGGEVLATAEWARSGRPFHTMLQMVDCDRLSNPLGVMDTKTLRRGIEMDRYGAPVAAHIRNGHPRDFYSLSDSYRWVRVAMRERWGRLQVLHLIDQTRPAMTRGVSRLAAVLKETRMASKFRDITLQNAIANASFAAAIESELPSNMAFEAIGATEGPNSGNSFTAEAAAYLEMVSAFTRGGRNLHLDGVKIPHLPPNSKLKLLPAGTVGGIGQSFEESLHRMIATGLNMSYEEYTHDYSKTNYSSSRQAANAMRRAMLSTKAMVADRVANAGYLLWLEEAVSEGHITALPAAVRSNANWLWEGMNLQAMGRASWIGASVGQVDEMKETQAAVLRIKNRLSTVAIECARLGHDYRDIFEQAAREGRQMKKLGIEVELDPTKPGTMSSERAGDDDAGDEDAAKPEASATPNDGFDGFDQ